MAGVLLALSYTADDGSVAAVPQPANLGRVRGLDLFHRFAAVLVHRADSRFGNTARQREASNYPRDLWHSRHGLARLGPPLGAL